MTKKQPPTGTPPPVHLHHQTKQPFSATQQPTDDVVLDIPATSVTISPEGVVAAAGEAGEPLKAESLRDGLVAANAQTADTIEGGPPGLPKDVDKFSLGFRIQMQIITVLAGFRFFMK